MTSAFLLYQILQQDHKIYVQCVNRHISGYEKNVKVFVVSNSEIVDITKEVAEAAGFDYDLYSATLLFNQIGMDTGAGIVEDICVALDNFQKEDLKVADNFKINYCLTYEYL